MHTHEHTHTHPLLLLSIISSLMHRVSAAAPGLSLWMLQRQEVENGQSERGNVMEAIVGTYLKFHFTPTPWLVCVHEPFL